MKIIVAVVLITVGLVCSIATLPGRQQDHVERHRGALGTGVVIDDAAATDVIRVHLAQHKRSSESLYPCRTASSYSAT